MTRTARRKRDAHPIGPADVPPKLRQLWCPDWEMTIALHLAEHPDDTFGAGMAAWYAWAQARNAWADQHGVPTDHQTRQKVMGPAGPPDWEWIAREFGTQPVPLTEG